VQHGSSAGAGVVECSPQGDPASDVDADFDAHLSPDAAHILLQNRAWFLRFIEQRVGSPALAEELLQDAYAKAIEHSGQLRSEETVVTRFSAQSDRRSTSKACRRKSGTRATHVGGRRRRPGTRGPRERRLHVCHGRPRDPEAGIQGFDSRCRSRGSRAPRLRDRRRNHGAQCGRATSPRARSARSPFASACGACARHGCIDSTCPSAG
jgi:hypothetical protein